MYLCARPCRARFLDGGRHVSPFPRRRPSCFSSLVLPGSLNLLKWLPVLSLSSSSSHLSPNLPPIASIARPPPPQRLLRALPNPSVLLSVIPDPHDHSCRTNPHPRTSGDRRRCALGTHAIRFPTRNTLIAPLGAHLLLSSHHAQTPDTPLRAPRPANVIPPSSRSCQD